MSYLQPEDIPEEGFTTITDVNSIYDLFNEDKISLRELDRLKGAYYEWYYSPERRTTVLRFYRQSDGTMTVYKKVYVQAYGENGNPELPEVVVTEVEGNVTAHIPGVRATAELSKLSPEGVTLYGLDPDNWFYFNRLINQSGIPRVGTLLLDKVLSYCKEKNYSIVNEVNAYGAISQRELEDWYIRKGFTPVDYKKYGNVLLKWLPQSSNPVIRIDTNEEVSQDKVQGVAIAWIGSKDVGSLHYSFKIGDAGELPFMQVDEEYRSLGVGEKMYEAVEVLARSYGVKKLTGEVGIPDYGDIERARKFWEKMGFTVENDHAEKQLGG